MAIWRKIIWGEEWSNDRDFEVNHSGIAIFNIAIILIIEIAAQTFVGLFVITLDWVTKYWIDSQVYG